MGRKLLLTIKVYFWMLVSGWVLSLALAGFSIFYYFKSEPEEAAAFKQRIALDMQFTRAWVEQHNSKKIKKQCAILRQPLGYRCFYYNTFTELELRQLSFVGYLDLSWRGILLIVSGDRELGKQPSVVGGTPGENNKIGQLRHWSSYISQKFTHALLRSELVDGIRYVTGSLPTKEMRKSAGLDAVKNTPALENFKNLDIQELKKTLNERNEAINQLEKMMDEQ